MTDAAIKAAIAAASASASASAAPEPQWVGAVRLPSSGREVQLVVPANLTPIEVVDIIGFVSTELPRQLVAANAARPRILVPG